MFGLINKVIGFYKGLPQWIQKGVTDAIESGLATAAAVQWAFPQNFADFKGVVIVVSGTFIGAVISGIRRAVRDHFTGS